MAEAVKELTPAGHLKRPSYETVASWVRDSWNAVDVNLIQKSFKCCGISNKRDETEDDWIFDYNRLGHGNQPSDEMGMPSGEDNEERKNEEDEDRETDDEYVDEAEETDDEYVDEDGKTDDEYVDEDKEGEYEENRYDEYH